VHGARAVPGIHTRDTRVRLQQVPGGFRRICVFITVELLSYFHLLNTACASYGMAKPLILRVATKILFSWEYILKKLRFRYLYCWVYALNYKSLKCNAFKKSFTAVVF